MTRYAVVDDQDIVTMVGNGSPPGGAILLPKGARVEAGRMMRDENGDFILRPVSPEPTRDGNDITIPPCPVGTRVEVMDVSGDERMLDFVTDTEGWSETYTLADAGRYQVIVTAPFPALQTVTNFEVEDAGS